MAAGAFRTELPVLQQASQHVLDVDERLQARLRSLWAQLEPLSTTWQGAAAASFSALHERWQADAAALNIALRGIGDALLANRSGYAAVEETAEVGFSRITSALSG